MRKVEILEHLLYKQCVDPAEQDVIINYVHVITRYAMQCMIGLRMYVCMACMCVCACVHACVCSCVHAFHHIYRHIEQTCSSNFIIQ